MTRIYSWNGGGAGNEICGESAGIFADPSCPSGYIIGIYSTPNPSAESLIASGCIVLGTLIVGPDGCLPSPPPGLPPQTRCDCLNGVCIPKATYNTPGKYANLALCQAGCAKDSACNGECVSPEEIEALQQAAAKVRGKLCGGGFV
jgi:hypothetical protein